MSTERHRTRACLSLLITVALVGAVILTCFSGTAASAATKAKRTEAAAELVREALHREIYGLDSERVSLLEKAKKQAPDYAPAMWHSGHVWTGRDWVKAVDVPQFTAEDRRLQMYHRERLTSGDTAAGHFELANWCRKMKMGQRERARLTRVIEFEPDHAVARQRLGFRRVDGRWVNVVEGHAAAQQARADAQTFQQWVKRLESIRRGLDGSRLQQEAATQRLLEIRDPAAAPAVEALFAGHSESAALTTIQTLAGMHAHQADLLVARIAVVSRWPAVREAAIESLQQRPFANFVPDMLDAMYAPTASTWRLSEGPGGRLLFRQTFVRESREGKEELVLETGYRRVALAGGSRVDTLGRALNDVMTTGQARSTRQIAQNLSGQQLNDRICDVLTDISGEQIAPEAGAWWEWWDQYNEISRPDQKPVDRRYQYQEVTLVDRVQIGTGGGGGGGGQSFECLAAGSKIWTDMGVKPIEEMQVGDMVLSQHPETGELAYKPVLRFTIRPASQLMTLNVGEQQITTSKGHLFWVSGEGWMMARDIQNGAELHALEGTVQLSTVQKAKFEPAYNLIVADFNNYFVGQRKPILCHDNSTPRKTDAVVPGLIDH